MTKVGSCSGRSGREQNASYKLSMDICKSECLEFVLHSNVDSRFEQQEGMNVVRKAVCPEFQLENF